MSRVYGRPHAHGQQLTPHVRVKQLPGLGAVPEITPQGEGRYYQGMPQQALAPYPQSAVRMDQIASMGVLAGPTDSIVNAPAFKDFNKIPTQYIISITLGGVAGNTGPGAVSLRPEPFVLTRISWATTGDTYPYTDVEPGYSLQGRAVRMTWGDEFTKLFGTTSCLVSAALGDSNGFLDIVKGLLFQGGQTLSLTLNRLHWPSALVAADTQWDFCFSGLSLLPPGVNQSGSAG